jgi:bifunctional UDP-N-acetylglucosamine pyrophosphorylase / glucosamine-1-phosphate N-acetyltransferase
MKMMTIILAAGQGTRMHSKLPKVLHPLAGKPLIMYSVENALRVTGEKPVVVVGYGADEVKQFLGDRALFVEQNPPLGTGHAVLQAVPYLKECDSLALVIAADMPLFQEETLRNLVELQQQNRGPITLASIGGKESRGFGRVVRDEKGNVLAVIEEAQATPEQLRIQEYNTSVYCFSASWLAGNLARIPISPKGEYYLTDLVGIAIQDGLSVQALKLSDNSEAIGINTRLHLAEAEAVLRERINRQWMMAGVTLVDPQSIYIEAEATLGMDTVIYPNTTIQGKTIVGENCRLGPNTIIREARIGNRCKVFSSVVEKAVMEDDVDIGPFGHLRSGAHLAQGVHMGNFGEVKNSYLGPGTKMGHFSYLGDANLGAKVNVGAGTITCNYDGEKKNHTEIGDNVFLGSDTMLVAPVKIGKGGHTGAGAVVTKDIPEDSLAVGVPAHVIRKLEKRE